MEFLRTYNTATTIYFPLVTAGGTAFQATWSPAASECQISIDGGAFANSNNAPAHEGSGSWSLALDAAEMQGTAIVVVLGDSSTDIEDQQLNVFTGLGSQIEANLGIYVIACDTGTTASTTTTMEADMIAPHTTNETTADHLNGAILLGTSGVLRGQRTSITDYALANGNLSLTFTAMTEAAGNGDRFVIV